MEYEDLLGNREFPVDLGTKVPRVVGSAQIVYRRLWGIDLRFDGQTLNGGGVAFAGALLGIMTLRF